MDNFNHNKNFYPYSCFPTPDFERKMQILAVLEKAGMKF